jgi:hypothetical protein
MPRLRQMAEEAARDPQSLAGRIEAKPAPGRASLGDAH